MHIRHHNDGIWVDRSECHCTYGIWGCSYDKYYGVSSLVPQFTCVCIVSPPPTEMSWDWGVTVYLVQWSTSKQEWFCKSRHTHLTDCNTQLQNQCKNVFLTEIYQISTKWYGSFSTCACVQFVIFGLRLICGEEHLVYSGTCHLITVL